MTSLPSIDQVRTLPAYVETTVPADWIDENGHMNITRYFELGSVAPWQRMGEVMGGVMGGVLGGPDDGATYITERGLSFFTVEHRVRYLGELRLGEPLSVRAAFVDRTAKALHAVSFVVDETRATLACTMEIVYVHVSMQTRRAVAVPDDVAAALDGEIAAHPWAAEAATGLSLRR